MRRIIKKRGVYFKIKSLLCIQCLKVCMKCTMCRRGRRESTCSSLQNGQMLVQVDVWGSLAWQAGRQTTNRQQTQLWDKNRHLTARMKNCAGGTFSTDPLSLLQHEDLVVWFLNDSFAFRIHHNFLLSVFLICLEASQIFAYHAS